MERLRILTIRAEILTGMDSPPADRQVRMAYQVQQLQHGLGQQRDTQFEPLLIEWIGTGGIPQETYNSYFSRFNQCRLLFRKPGD